MIGFLLRPSVKRLLHPVVAVVGIPLARVLDEVLRRSALKAGVALVYHRIDPVQGDLDRELVAPHGANLFEEQMRYLRRCYRIVDATELPSAAARRQSGEPFPVAVTFDDDLASHVVVALPILLRVGVSATFFVSGASLERPFAFWWERLQDAMDRGLDEPVMAVTGLSPGALGPRAIHAIGTEIEELAPERRDEVAEALAQALGRAPETSGMRARDIETLVGAGHAIGFHTRRHDPLPSLADDALHAAMRTGRSEIEALVGAALSAIAYPHGRADRRVAAAACRAGFSVGFTGSVEPIVPSSDPLLLGRMGGSYRSPGHFALQLVRTLVSGRR